MMFISLLWVSWKRQLFLHGWRTGVLVFLLLGRVCLALATEAPPHPLQKNILLLNSYHPGFKWTDDETRGVVSTLAHSEGRVKLFTEYMGTKWTANAPYFSQLVATYKEKFSTIHFDAIIATDNDAFNFLRAHRDEIFGQVPVSFCGVNNFHPDELQGHAQYTGINETVDFQENIELLLRLHPNTRRIVVIVDTSVTGQQVRRELLAIIPRYAQKIDFEILGDLTLQELLDRLAHLSKDCVVLQTIFFRDTQNRIIEYDESAELISRASTVPVYGTWDFSQGHGIVGGKLTTGFDQGRIAAEAALRILQGEPADAIPVVMQSPSRFMFDYQQMQRFGIALHDLPKESLIINQPATSYSIPKDIVWAFTTGSVVLAGFIIALLVNIRQRELARQQFRDSERQYQMLVENINVGIYRRAGGKDGKIIQANSAILKIFGFDPLESFEQARIIDIYQQEKDIDAFLQELKEKGSLKNKEICMKKKDGTSIIISCNATAIFDDNHEIKWIDGVVEDITEKKKLEEQLRQSQKMESLGALAAGVAHDFNNILMVITGYGTMLHNKISQQPELDHYLSPILSSAEKAAQLTRSLLAFSRKQVIDPKPIDLNAVIANMERLLTRLIGEDIELHTAPAPAKEVTVMADQSQMEQILLNLVANARDAMPKGGLICISAEQVVVSEREMLLKHQFSQPGKYVVLSVSDTGEGMEQAVQCRIFEPFYSTKAVGKGTGLGLSIVHGIVKQHNGDISVYSEPGKGTTFKIYLPLFTAGAAELPGAASSTLPPVVGGTETILLGEDDLFVRQWIITVLAQAGYRVIEACNGEELVALFQQNPTVDMVLLDVVMPKKNGREAMDAMKKIHPAVKSLFMSGYTADIIHHKGILDHSVNFISKPLTQEALLRKVREVLDQKAPPSH